MSVNRARAKGQTNETSSYGMQKEVVTLEEINQTYPWLKIATLQKMCSRGDLPGKKVGDWWVVKIEDVQKLVKGEG